MTADKATLDELAITEGEYQTIVDNLLREPNTVELGLFGSLWSEHCGYKHSKPLLRLFPNKTDRLLVEPGTENAGAVSIGNGLAIVMKIESHNHPSAIEPFHGAATGVGGIVRDILAMGARPTTLMNSLRFGPIDQPRNKFLFERVVGGISWYGNCIGVPDVGGEIYFSPSYQGNPLVNAMCTGLVPQDHIMSATAEGDGNLIMLVGASTGRDGIHGASGLASRTFEEDRELRPTIQVGNPFLEKVLIEACLELIEKFPQHIIGMQDLGAAGLTSAVVESASKSKDPLTGVSIDIGEVPRRESGMTPYEVMLSESQERMLFIVKKGYEERVKEVFQKWDLNSSIIGRVTHDGVIRVRDKRREEACLPIQLLTTPPEYKLEAKIPEYINQVQNEDLSKLPIPAKDPNGILLELLESHNIASKETVYQQYDHQVQTNTIVSPGGDAAVIRVRGGSGSIALSTDGNGRYCYLDPWHGGAIAVAEACRNLSCVGASPIAITDCLNFGDPQSIEGYYQMEECIKGMAEACKKLKVPVISGNVSLFNESKGQAIYPTPVVGSLGVLSENSLPCTHGFKADGDSVVLLGVSAITGNPEFLGGSEYLDKVHNKVVGKPIIDLDLEARVQAVCREAIAGNILNSAHDCSDGGVAIALAESCIANSMGFRGEFEIRGRWDAAIFGENQSRILVSLPNKSIENLEQITNNAGVPMIKLGTVGGRGLVIPGLISIGLKKLSDSWENGLKRNTAEQ